MKIGFLLFLCCAAHLVVTHAQDAAVGETLETENEESVVTIRKLLSEDGEEVPSLITIFTNAEENPVMSGIRTEFQLPPGEYRVRAKSRDVVVPESLVVPVEPKPLWSSL